MIIDFKYWLKVGQKLLILAVSIFLIYLGFKLSIFYIPFLIAFIISLLIEPVIKFCMKKFKMRRKWSAILIFFIILSIIIGLIAWGIITLFTEATGFLNNFNMYFDKIYNNSQNLISKFDLSKIQISDDIRRTNK